MGDFLQRAYIVFKEFTRDGNLDEAELKYLLHMALKDRVLSEEERDVLCRIFKELPREQVSDAVWEEIQTAREKHSLY